MLISVVDASPVIDAGKFIFDECLCCCWQVLVFMLVSVDDVDAGKCWC